MKYLLIVVIALFAGISIAQAAPGHTGSHGGSTGEAAFGQPGDPKKSARVVQVLMNNKMRFVPGSITVKAGENIRFVVKNTDAIDHEMVIGTQKDLEEHAELMRKFPEMEHVDENMIRVPPSKSGDVYWRFTKAGTYYLGCLIPGHLEAGMMATVVVK